ncbi:hypothetical protein [Allokutzneria sp. NRRL B-24872]|uniref:hypothetical protein n=1 Tax=Allokutzneria sp. NRRL B-24872 TaxID=1137961 RepID=UPI001177DC4B|nr:hypothetical protein [Allokutzneria sp. NRRL B-24872]
MADPVVEWVFPGPVEQRRAGAARVFAPLVAASAEAGELAVLDDGAAAVWLPVAAGTSLMPGPEVEMPPRLRVLVDSLARNHSTEREHLYLAFIGVARGKQGQGLGAGSSRSGCAMSTCRSTWRRVRSATCRSTPATGSGSPETQ